MTRSTTQLLISQRMVHPAVCSGHRAIQMGISSSRGKVTTPLTSARLRMLPLFVPSGRRDTIKRWTSQGRTPQQISAAMGWSVGVIEADLNAMKDFWTPPPLDPGTATVDVWPFENRGYRVKGPDGRWYLLQTPSGHVARCRAGEAGLPDVLHRNSVGGKARFAWTDGEMVAAIEYPITVLREKKVLDTESNG